MTSANTNPLTVEPILESGIITVNASLTDRRLRTGTDSRTINELAYHKPIVSMNAGRGNAYGALDPSGEYITCNFQSTIASLNGINTGI